jgi:hypothetical protein
MGYMARLRAILSPLVVVLELLAAPNADMATGIAPVWILIPKN